MRKYGLPLLLSILFILLLLFPGITKAGASEGLFLWYNSIVPILFPFIILSNLMDATDSFSWFLQPLFLIKKIVPFLHPWYYYAMLLGFFCGYPMGAKVLCDLIRKNKISVSEGNLLLPVINQASPMFLAGYVGVQILENALPLSALFLFLYLPPLLFFFVSVFLTNISKKTTKKELPYPDQLYHQTKKDSMPLSMEHTIWDSFFIIVTIGVYMMLFSILMKLASTIFPQSDLVAIGSCFLEFSTGLHQLKEITLLTKQVKYSLILALTSFGGFCTMAQTYSITRDTGLSMKSYFIKKGIIAFFVFWLTYSSLSSS